MPLRDHFRPPLDDLRHWGGFHATWPVMIIASLRQKLPHPYFAEPQVHSGASAEIDVATFEKEEEEILPMGEGTRNGGGIAWSGLGTAPGDVRPRHRLAGSGCLRGVGL
jgi:hypothetical protein